MRSPSLLRDVHICTFNAVDLKKETFMQDKNPGKEFKVFFLISYYCSVMERVNRFMEMIKKLIASYINIRKHKDHFYSIDVVVIPIYSILKY